VSDFLEFDEQRLSQRLGVLPLNHQAVFVASCCERAAPTCIEFAERSYMQQEAQLCKDVTEVTWQGSLDPEARLQERSVANELWRFAMIETDWAQPLST
jgi:uncharacterized protein YjaG (DUF416 family)